MNITSFTAAALHEEDVYTADTDTSEHSTSNRSTAHEYKNQMVAPKSHKQ